VAYALLFHDQVLQVNQWDKLPYDRKELQAGLEKWVEWKSQ